MPQIPIATVDRVVHQSTVYPCWLCGATRLYALVGVILSIVALLASSMSHGVKDAQARLSVAAVVGC